MVRSLLGEEEVRIVRPVTEGGPTGGREAREETFRKFKERVRGITVLVPVGKKDRRTNSEGNLAGQKKKKKQSWGKKKP